MISCEVTLSTHSVIPLFVTSTLPCCSPCRSVSFLHACLLPQRLTLTCIFTVRRTLRALPWGFVEHMKKQAYSESPVSKKWLLLQALQEVQSAFSWVTLLCSIRYRHLLRKIQHSSFSRFLSYYSVHNGEERGREGKVGEARQGKARQGKPNQTFKQTTFLPLS